MIRIDQVWLAYAVLTVKVPPDGQEPVSDHAP